MVNESKQGGVGVISLLGPSLIDHSTNIWPFCILENDACSPMPVYKRRYPDSTLWTQGMCDLGAECNGCALVTGFTDPPPPCLNEAPEVCVESPSTSCQN